jgi:hypothetical protein
MEKKQPAGRELQGRTPADEVELKKSVSRARKAFRNLSSELKRRRNKNALWKF